MITPRFRISGEGDMATPSIQRVRVGVFIRVDLDPIRMSSVLELFNIRKFWFIQLLISDRQASK